MDFHCIEALLGLPEFRVIHVGMNAKQLELHLERRDTFIVCPRCQTCCSRVQDSRPRCLRDLPMLDHPVVLWLHLRRFACAACHHRPWEKSETFGEHVKWTTRLYTQVRQAYLHGCPCREWARRYGLSERTVFRWTFERSRGGRPRKLGRAMGIDEDARRKGHRSNTLLVNVDTGKPIATFKGRRAEEVMAWFQSRPQAERDQGEGWEDGDVTWVTPTDVTRNNHFVLLDSEKKITEAGLQNSSAKLVPPHAVLMTSRASIGFFAVAGREVCTNQGFISVVTNDDVLSPYLLFHLSDRVEEVRSMGSGSTYPEVSRGKFREFEVMVPEMKLVSLFAEQADLLLKQIRILKQQTQKLRAARDLLLPRLMSGKISV